MRGCSRRHRLSLPLWCPVGAWRFWLPVDFAAVVPKGVACLSCRLPTPPLPSFLPPIPPTPFPGGEGGDSKFISPGAPPPAPPALNRLRHLQNLPYKYPAAEICGLPQNRQEAVPYEQCRQPRRGGTGGEELWRLRWSSPPGQVEQMPHGERSPDPRRAAPEQGRIARWRRGLPCLAGSAGVSGTRLRRGGFGRRLDLPPPSPTGGGQGQGSTPKAGVGRRQRGKTSSPVAAPCKKIFKSP